MSRHFWILCSILKAVPSPAFEPNGAGSFQTLEPRESLSRSWTQPGSPTAGDMGTFPPLPLNLGRVGSQLVNGLHKFLIAKLSRFLNMFAGSGKKRLSCCSGLSGSLWPLWELSHFSCLPLHSSCVSCKTFSSQRLFLSEHMRLLGLFGLV